MKEEGKIGCGCLTTIFIFVLLFVFFLHPFTLRFLGSRFEFSDKIEKAEAIFVPFFSEDRKGELYNYALREYVEGERKILYIEDDILLNTTICKLFLQLARERGVQKIKVECVKTEGDLEKRMEAVKKYFNHKGIKKVIVLSPSYASLRLHLLLKKSNGTEFLIKPCSVDYFKKDKWWKDSLSRSLLLKEFSAISSYYLEKFKYGIKREDGKG